jgi:hypothetical protein
VQLKIGWFAQPDSIYTGMATTRTAPLHRRNPPKPQPAFHPPLAMGAAQGHPLKDQSPPAVGAVALPLMDAGSPVPTGKNTGQKPQKPFKNKHLTPFPICYSDIKIILSIFKNSDALGCYKSIW